MRDVTLSCAALETRRPPVEPLTLSALVLPTSSSTALPRAGTLTTSDEFAVPVDGAPAVKYSTSAVVGDVYEGLKTRTSVTNVCPPVPTTRPATGTSYSFAGT